MPFNTQAMRIIVDNFNEVLEQERERHGIPIEHFEPLGADVHPVQLVASRMFSILAKPHTELCSDILTVIKGMSRRPHEKTYWQDFRVTHMALLSEDKMVSTESENVDQSKNIEQEISQIMNNKSHPYHIASHPDHDKIVQQVYTLRSMIDGK